MSERAHTFPPFRPGRRIGKKFADTWWGNAWIAEMETTALDPDQLKKGRRYAFGGHVGPITVSPGRISASVHDGDHYQPYQTLVRLAELSDAEWDRFLDRVAAKAGHIAALLDREMPRELVGAAEDAGVRLLPSHGDLDPECDCPGWDYPCQHAAALSYQASWLLDRDPFVLLLIRGRGEEELSAELRRRNTGRAGFAATRQSQGTPAPEAYSARPGPLPALPRSVTGEPLVLAPLLAAAEEPGIDPAALSLLAQDAAARAADLLAAGPGDDLVPERDPRRDAVRLAAHCADSRLVERLGQASGRAADFSRAVRAWEYSGAAGLDSVDTVWSPPKTAMSWVGPVVVAAWQDSGRPGTPELSVWRNRWTVMGQGVQLRYGQDGLWYPFRAEPGGWSPAGPPTRDPSAALLDLLPD